METTIRRGGISVGIVLLAVGVLPSACGDSEEIVLTGPALEEVVEGFFHASLYPRHYPDNLHGTSLSGMDHSLVYIAGVRVPERQEAWALTALRAIGGGDIEKINIIRGSKAVEQYGPEAKDGVILITIKESRAWLYQPRTGLKDSVSKGGSPAMIPEGGI